MAEQNNEAPRADAEESPQRQVAEYSDGSRNGAGNPDPLRDFIDEHGDVDTSCFLNRSQQQSPPASHRGTSPATAPLGYLDGNDGMWKL